MNRPLLPEVVSIGMRPSSSGEQWPWHTHDFDEICLFANDTTTVGHGGQQMRVAAGTAVLYLRGERHGFWNDRGEAPDLWVVHFDVDPVFYDYGPPLPRLSLAQRVLPLTAAQHEAFAGLFVKISLESAFDNPNARTMASAWLQLLLANIMRWREPGISLPETDARPFDAELLELWQTLSEHVTAPFTDMDRLPDLIPNYDSARHRFKRAFGASPMVLLSRMRMQLAQNLLIEGRMSVKEVAHAVGYTRQHEFSRAFRRHTGEAPMNWRRHPPHVAAPSPEITEEDSKSAK